MKTILLSLLCAGLAAGGFFAGIAYNKGQAATSLDKSSPAITRIVAGEASSKAAALSANKEVTDFLTRFEVGKGPLSPDKMKAAIAEALAESDPVKAQLLFARLMEELTPENAPSVLAMIREKGGFGPENFGFLRMLAHTWGGIDPAGAMKGISEGPGGGPGGGRFGQGFVLAGWAAKDPEAAIKWLEKNPAEGREGDMMNAMLISSLARSNPEQAMAYAKGLKDDNSRQDAAQTIARELMRSGSIDTATDWLKSLTDDSMKKGAFDAIAGQLAGRDPAKAAELVKAHAAEGYASGAVREVAQRLGDKNPADGLKFASEIPGKPGAEATGQVIRDWMRRDDGKESEAASQYVADMKPGLAKDNGAAAIARSVVREDVKTALVWAGSIQDPETKVQSLMDVGERYRFIDEAGFNAWLPVSGLDAAQQAEVIKNAAEGGGGRGRGGFGGGPPGGGGGGGFGGRRGR